MLDTFTIVFHIGNQTNQSQTETISIGLLHSNKLTILSDFIYQVMCFFDILKTTSQEWLYNANTTMRNVTPADTFFRAQKYLAFCNY